MFSLSFWTAWRLWYDLDRSIGKPWWRAALNACLAMRRCARERRWFGPSYSQRMRAAGFTRRPSRKSAGGIMREENE